MRYKHIILSIFLALFFVGCTSDTNNGDASTVSDTNGTVVETNTTTPVVVDTNNTIDVNGTLTVNFSGAVSTRELTVNNELVSIEVLVFGPDNAPYTGGTISIAYPQKATTGVSVGSFTSLNVDVVDGKAVFNYTGPKDLKALVDKNDTSTVFGFYHSSNASSVKDFTFTYSPLADQIILETYSVKSSLSDGNITLGLESSKFISFYVENDTGTKVDDSKMTSIKVDVLNTPLAELRDTLGNSGDSLTFTENNDVSLSIESGTISGLVPIKVTAAFKDANDVNVTIEDVFNIVVLSGPPTAMSISYASTSHDADYAKFQENLVVTVTDKYFNPVNTNPAITAGVIVGYAKDGTGANIYYTPNSATTGTLDSITKIFTANNGMDFSNVDELNDVFTTFGVGYSYDASGKWDFTRSGAANTNELAIIDDHNSNVTRSNLGFAIGHNYREIVCEPWREKVGTIKVADGSSKLDSRGMAKLTLDYDYYLTGKDVVVWVNLVGFTAETGVKGKIGEATEFTLLGQGLEAASAPVSAGVVSATYTIPIWVSETGKTYKNARFAYNVKVSDNLTINAITDTNGDLSNCSASVSITVTENEGKAGTIEIINLLVADEFEN